MLLFLFVIMLVNLDQAAHERQFNRAWPVGLAAVLAVGAEVGYFLYRGKAAFHIAEAGGGLVPPVLGNTEMIADSLFSEYLLPFEIASLLLLVAVVGSVAMAKRRI
jgi:NADH-quinone oxidoreductase subunit J